MTKLDEAVESAKESSPIVEEVLRDGEIKDIIQAAVKMLVPKLRPDYPHDEWKDIHDTGHNACRSQTLKNAGIE